MTRPKGPKGQFVVCVCVWGMYRPSWANDGVASLLGNLELTMFWSPRKLITAQQTTFNPSYSDHARLKFQCDERTTRGTDVGLGFKPSNEMVCWYGPRWEFEAHPNAVRTATEVTRLLGEWPDRTHSVNSLLLMLGNVVVVKPDLSNPGYYVTERRALIPVTRIV